MSEEANTQGPPAKRRRRRRRRRRGPKSSEQTPAPQEESASADPSRKRGRRQAVDISGPQISVPSSGRNPHRKRNSRAKRGTPGSVGGRRRRLSRTEVKDLNGVLDRMPDALVANLYRGLGGQPNRVASRERMLQLTVRAIAQGSRLSNLLKQMHERDRKAVAAMLQCGGIAHSDEFLRELILSYGGQEREWRKTLTVLSDKGLLVATGDNEPFFYVIPEPLLDGLLAELDGDLELPVFHHDDMRLVDHQAFCPPLDFTITTLAAYVDQNAPRLTQRHEIYRHDKEEMDAFFGQIWNSDSDLFAFHIDFLMSHGMIELRGEYLSLNRDVMEEWLSLEPEDQRDLLFTSLNKRFAFSEWVLWAIHGAGEDDGWVAERPLAALYRRWKRGDDWKERFKRGQVKSVRTSDRESFTFAPLVRCGLLELGQWGQEKFYRLSPRGRMLLEPDEDDGFRQFYLTPSFEVMAPAGLAPILLFRIGELAELAGCDRANTYKITETSVERAIERGWRRDEVLQFLRDNSQIGLPENVEATLKGWIGHRGDVEFHDLSLLTVHRSQIRRLEGNKRIKPYLLHRFAPGMYAIDRHRRDEIIGVLQESGFDPARDVRNYPGDPEQVEARQRLRRLVAEAREEARDPKKRRTPLEPEAMRPVPGSRVARNTPASADTRPPEVAQDAIRPMLESAIARQTDIEMVYIGKTGQSIEMRVQPQRLAFKSDTPVLVGLDRESDERRTFLLHRIRRLRVVEEDA